MVFLVVASRLVSIFCRMALSKALFLPILRKSVPVATLLQNNIINKANCTQFNCNASYNISGIVPTFNRKQIFCFRNFNVFGHKFRVRFKFISIPLLLQQG